MVCGLNDDAIAVLFSALSANSTAGVNRANGIGLDATNAFVGLPGVMSGAVNHQLCAIGTYTGLVGLGSHFLQAIEWSTASGTTTWAGDLASSGIHQSGLQATWMM